MKEIEKIEKELAKKGYLVKKASEVKQEPKLRTDIFGLDWVLDGGIAMIEGGDRIEFWGAEGTGKTTFALYTIKKYQELEKICAFMDIERAYDKNWAENIGINNDNLLMSYPENLEQAGDIFVDLIPSVDLIVVDSIVSLIPIGELERDTEEAQVALQARVNSLIVRKIYHAIAGRLTTLLFINQLREKVGQRYGNPWTTAGGRAIKHMYNTRVEFKTGKPIKKGDEKIGIEINLNCTKNKRGKPFHKACIDFYLDGRLDNNKSLFFAGRKFNIIEREGNTYNYKDFKQVGEEKFIKNFTKWNQLEEEIWQRIK